MSARPGSGHGIVLLVDDDPGMLDTLVDIIASSGYDVETAHSGAAAVAMVEQSRFDVTLMDVQMPGLNGVEALKAMRAIAPSMAVIMMTAFTRDELVEEARQSSAVEVLSKPLDVRHVLDLIRSLTVPRSGERSA
jgi:CheY-like chemotaxis protein